MEDGDQGVDRRVPALDAGARDAGERREGLSAWLILRTLRDLAGDDGRPQRALGAVIGRLDARVVEETQQVSVRVAPTQVLQEVLVAGVRHRPLPEEVGEAGLQPRCLGREVGGRPGPLPVPQRQGLAKRPPEPEAEGPPPSPFGLQQVTDRPLEVAEALLLLDSLQLVRVVALAAVGAQRPRVVGRNDSRTSSLRCRSRIW